MPRRDFKATEGLLHDVMRKQSGVIEKAWLEALMNSVDAGATEFDLDATSNVTTITDNGDSMSKSDVSKYFENFGLKDDDIHTKQFGKFRMGRGQIFNFGVNVWRARENYMVVGLDDEAVRVSLSDCTATDDESIIDHSDDDYTVNTSGIGYVLLDAETHDEGMSIHVNHYNPIEHLSKTVDEFKDLARYVSWLHDIDVTVNGDSVDHEPEVIEETDTAWFVESDSSFSNYSPVYNKGAYVDQFNIGPKRLGVITKYDLDVTLDRTDILETDDYWVQVQSQYTQVVERLLADSESLSIRETNWLIVRASENIRLMNEIKDSPIIQDVAGDYRTIAELSTARIGFSTREDNVAKDAMGQGDIIVIQEEYQNAIEEFAANSSDTIAESSLKTYDELIDDGLVFEMTEIEVDDLSKKRYKNMRRLANALRDLGYSGAVKPGYSNHRDVWKDNEGVLFIDKNYLNSTKQEVATEVLYNVIRGAAHDGDSRPGMDEDYAFNRSFYQMVNGDKIGSTLALPKVQAGLMNGEYDS